MRRKLNIRQAMIDSYENKMKKEKRKKRRGLFLSVVAISVAIPSCIMSFLSGCSSSKKNKKENIDTTQPTSLSNSVDYYEELTTHNINLMGVSLKTNQEKTSKSLVSKSGNVDVNSIKVQKGTVWASERSASQAANVGKSVLDDKGGTLQSRSDGNAQEKQKYYEVVDENKNVVDSGKVGNNGIPDGYEKSQNGKIIEQGHFVAPDGTVWDSEKRYREYLESLKTDGEDTKTEFIPEVQNPEVSEQQKEPETKPEESPSKPEQTKPQESPKEEETKKEELPSNPEQNKPQEPEDNFIPDAGVINSDGTYTVNGETYKSKEDFYQFIIDPTGYMKDPDDGIIKPVDDVYSKTNNYQKVISMYHVG